MSAPWKLLGQLMRGHGREVVDVLGLQAQHCKLGVPAIMVVDLGIAALCATAIHVVGSASHAGIFLRIDPSCLTFHCFV